MASAYPIARSGRAAHPSAPAWIGSRGFRRLGKALFVVGAIAAVGDVVTTWLLLRVVPGGYEANGIMASLMRGIGLTPALALRGIVGVSYAWVVGGIVAGRYRVARAMFASRWWAPLAVPGAAVLTAGALCVVVAHNAAIILAYTNV